MKNRFYIFAILFAQVGTSCDDAPAVRPVSFQWVASDYSKVNSSFFSFTEGDDGALYSVGFLDNQYGIHKAMLNNEWRTIAKLTFMAISVQDFAIFKEDIYLVDKQKLWKVSGETVEEVDFGNQFTARVISSVTTFKGKLVVTGDFADATTNRYSMIYFDGSGGVTPIAPLGENRDAPGYLVFQTPHRIFFGDGADTFGYDGSRLREVAFQGGFLTVSPNNDFFTREYYDPGGERQERIVKWTNGRTVNLGEPFSKHIDIRAAFLKDNYIIAIGDDTNSGLSVSYVFNNDTWTPIPTTNYFFGMFSIGDLIYAYTIDGIIIELEYEM